MPSHIWGFVFPLQTGSTGAIVKTGDMVPLHQITDTAAGIPWYVTTSPSFSTSQPAFQRFSLTTTCPASKRNSIASLMSGSGACKLPEVSHAPSHVASRKRSGEQHYNTHHINDTCTSGASHASGQRTRETLRRTDALSLR
ncbi:hypothetical protein E2C01_024887 [Portunus trituberculatus]|uniref:Uncharacterized protein n=1 Tax=Portunus trituberculatus TaxID=210409 RepID=A0A5B7EBQ7_PORTR|nr:hypothetical protein [Portunus trituberculatus]